MIDTQMLASPTGEQHSDTIALIQKHHKAGRPVVLTIDGAVQLTVSDTQSCQLLIDLVDRLETIDAIREGIASVDRGEGRPVQEVFADLERRYEAADRRYLLPP